MDSTAGGHTDSASMSLLRSHACRLLTAAGEGHGEMHAHSPQIAKAHSGAEQYHAVLPAPQSHWMGSPEGS